MEDIKDSGPRFILWHVAGQFSQNHLFKGLSFPRCIFLPPSLKINDICMGLFLESLLCSFDLYVCFHAKLYFSDYYGIII